jgi:hypothetical protein
LYLVSCGVLLLGNIHCGGLGEKKLNEIDARVTELQAMGVPDSITSNIKIHIYNFKTAKRLGNGSEAAKHKDSITSSLATVESWYQKSLELVKPLVTTAFNTIQTEKASLSGLHLKVVDSAGVIIDSLLKTEKFLEAKKKVDELNSIMPLIKKNQEKANSLRPKLIGKWSDVHTITPDEGNYKAVESRAYTFKDDGTYEGTEKMLGQTAEYFKEDWEFITWGKYDLKGDTIQMTVEREKCVKQIFTQYNLKDKKWVTQVKPTYDSTITNRSKDKYIEYSYLKTFKKSK